MGSLADKRSPFDPAPDWANQTYGQRISSALTLLTTFGFLTEDEAVIAAIRIEEWFDKAMMPSPEQE